MRFGHQRNRTSTTRTLVSGKNLPKRFEILLAQELDEGTRDFLTSLQNHYRKKKGLTEPQYAGFEKVESKHSPEAQRLNAAWKKEYDEDKRELMRIAAHYYLADGRYFKDLAEKALNTKGFLPTRRQYQAMVKNKFAQKVIKATQEKPKFGDKNTKLCQLSKTTPFADIPRGVERECLVLIVKPNSSPVTSAARGAKKYLVLPFGHTDAFEIEERYLKKYRGNLDDAS